MTNKDDLPFDDVSLSFAWQALQHDMAMVPGGDVQQVCDSIIATNAGFEIVPSPNRVVSVDSIYLDRDCVTNADFARFVESDGYGNPDLWPAVILPNVLQFSDSSGQPGPKYWVNGDPPSDKLDHPVVGISWYEASAFATWAGKRLPSSAEWQRAGTWPKGHSSDGTELHFPWGNGFDPAKANVWSSGVGDTVAVTEFERGRTPNGVRQLVGNVWEWVDTQFEPSTGDGVSVLLDQTMAEIRGGAFDTYFQTQATCQFHTGQPLLFRGANVGFRCCVSASEIPDVDRGVIRSSEAV
ncbi:formylglycine-generating enzyme family protein [Rubripirellula lacrimiformis]|uniref:formylglycine-generating enzyme family protein n=1 Tax=Rubripirellula lacrimiformis TaxID=1930273 RepID=UPI0011A4D7D3|nr:formylglycine-generating enzyme family protein [Rubripirellula lacrimiformis]